MLLLTSAPGRFGEAPGQGEAVFQPVDDPQAEGAAGLALSAFDAFRRPLQPARYAAGQHSGGAHLLDG